MREEINNSIQWEKASKAGLVLALISSAYLFINSYLAKFMNPEDPSIFLNIFTIILWSIKFVACFWFMKFFMIKLAFDYKGVDKRIAFKYGVKIALLSALAYSIFYMANMLYISNDVIQEYINLAIQQSQSLMDRNTLNALDQIKDKLPITMSFFQFIYCFAFGVILSKIISKTSIPDKNIFD